MRPVRKKMRLAGWDYSNEGSYFLTLCAKNRKCIFSQVVGCGILDAPEVQLSKYGEHIQSALMYIEENAKDIILHKYIIMPNHVHLLVTVKGERNMQGGASGMPRPTNERVPKMVSSIKRFSSKQSGIDLWQKQYFDRIVRSEQEFLRIWQYIDNNPAMWLEDEYYVI